MARLSVDDMVSRDPRITRLAAALGLSRYEVVGRLVCDVWPICYDRMSATISPLEVDAATLPGFASAMVDAGLAWREKRGLRIAGASERIEYLERKRASGKAGGLASGKKRAVAANSNGRSTTTGTDAKASWNPPDLVPDPVPDPVPDVAIATVPDPEREPRTRARKTLLPDGWNPDNTGPNVQAHTEAVDRGVGLQRELEAFRDYARARAWRMVDWNATWRNWIRRAQGARRGDSVFAALDALGGKP